MRISAKAEYACLAMLELAANHDESQPVRIKSIAEAHGIPQRFLVQILLQLKSAGLVTSTRGASGGYHLGRPPAEISLADVIAAIDRDSARSNPVGNPHSPAVQTLRAVWQEARAAEQRLLRSCTLAELARRMSQSDALSYQI